MTDFHTHILPALDDGSRNCEESAQMLKELYRQGVTVAVATPHFYPMSTGPDRFFQKREESFSALKNFIISNDSIPSIRLGAEVSYFDGIADCGFLEKFIIEGTNLILIEMPFCRWSPRMVDEIYEIKKNRGLTPLIAHIDRYLSFNSNAFYIFDPDKVLVQVNASACVKPFLRIKTLKMIKEGRIHALGSDCHNMTDRAPNIGAANEYLKKKASQVSLLSL
ncbi:MAG: capsular polysaccharide biosynthesis protein [Clostridiales bacterium]|nr:capsular polysaccharide biosynthesis protein [Clostridiales bacterium]